MGRTAQLQTQMFEAVAAIGGLDVQLVYYRGPAECQASRWMSDARSLATIMARIVCAAGETQIGRVLTHTRKEHARQKVDAVILVSDACEERPADLFAQARELAVPVFLFRDEGDLGDDGEHSVGAIYNEITRLTGVPAANSTPAPLSSWRTCSRPSLPSRPAGLRRWRIRRPRRRRCC
jgi:hypothetical protein